MASRGISRSPRRRTPEEPAINKASLNSSLGVPFLVVSDRQLVKAKPPPTATEWGDIQARAVGIAKHWETKGVAILADFEGEFTGFEGELVTACFQRTFAIDPRKRNLKPLRGKGVCHETGLLIDLRCEQGVALAKRIMESQAIVKLIWGADGDLTSLRYTPAPRPLGINSARVVDVQLAFSIVGSRLGMAKMLERVPRLSVAGLPAKGAIDFDTPHACNRRALSLPLSREAVTYALDDLHRIDAILQSQEPTSGTYAQAQQQTDVFIFALAQSPADVSAEKLQQNGAMLKRKTGVVMQAIAVRVKRHLIALRRLGFTMRVAEFATLEREVDQCLAGKGVSVPLDLRFSI